MVTAQPVVGHIVIIPFPFSDLSASKPRPALVVARSSLPDDWILCQITSQPFTDPAAIKIPLQSGCSSGDLPIVSDIRASKLFTAHVSLMLNKDGALRIAATLSPKLLAQVHHFLRSLFR